MLLIDPDTVSDSCPSIADVGDLHDEDGDLEPVPKKERPLTPSQSALAGQYWHLVAQVLTKFIKKTARDRDGRRYIDGNADDLESAGMGGLMDAARAFDPDDGRPFKPYATTCIRHAMLDEIERRESRLVEVRQSERVRAHVVGREAGLKERPQDEVADVRPGPPEQLIDGERRNAVDELPEDLQDIGEGLEDGLSLGKIGKRLGLTKSAVQKRVNRIRELCGVGDTISTESEY